MFAPGAKKDELKEAFLNRVNTARKANPILCQITSSIENKGANLTAINQAKAVAKMGKDLNTKLNKLTVKKKTTGK